MERSEPPTVINSPSLRAAAPWDTSASASRLPTAKTRLIATRELVTAVRTTTSLHQTSPHYTPLLVDHTVCRWLGMEISLKMLSLSSRTALPVEHLDVAQSTRLRNRHRPGPALWRAAQRHVVDVSVSAI